MRTNIMLYLDTKIKQSCAFFVLFLFKLCLIFYIVFAVSYQPQIYLQVRQFMMGIKNYLIKHGEGNLKGLIETEREKV